jgi:hypothetical protein
MRVVSPPVTNCPYETMRYHSSGILTGGTCSILCKEVFPNILSSHRRSSRDRSWPPLTPKL